MIYNPCTNCKKRNGECHATCNRYKVYRYQINQDRLKLKDYRNKCDEYEKKYLKYFYSYYRNKKEND